MVLRYLYRPQQYRPIKHRGAHMRNATSLATVVSFRILCLFCMQRPVISRCIIYVYNICCEHIHTILTFLKAFPKISSGPEGQLDKSASTQSLNVSDPVGYGTSGHQPLQLYSTRLVPVPLHNQSFTLETGIGCCLASFGKFSVLCHSFP